VRFKELDSFEGDRNWQRHGFFAIYMPPTVCFYWAAHDSMSNKINFEIGVEENGLEIIGILFE
jgi:hypothetical protein